MYRDIPGELRQLIEPVISDHGCELVDATVTHRPTTVRITVDNESGDGRVGVDVCAVGGGVGAEGRGVIKFHDWVVLSQLLFVL